MNNKNIIYINLLIISATVICFEIISTRISSVIFVSNYAFMILSLSILGLGLGGVFSFYILQKTSLNHLKLIFNIVVSIGITLILFIVSVNLLYITNPFVYFLLNIIPFFIAGIFYSQVYKFFAENSFVLYAYDLAGAALGCIVSIFLLNYFAATNGILFLSLLVFSAGILLVWNKNMWIIKTFSFSILVLFASLVITNSNRSLFGNIPIGNYPEKDFYHVYQNAQDISIIKESRWSIYGRTDLVEYKNQNFVKQLFIDGAAGSPMYRFNGNVNNPGLLLANNLVNNSTAIPFSFLSQSEKNSMLIIGPGGGKEVLLGLLYGIEYIKGVEVNPGFVNLVKEYHDFNGGIYSDFQNVDVEIAEGRHFIKHLDYKFDIISLVLPSTEQLQSIDNLASNENFLLTVESIQEYFEKLTPEGQLIFTVHNRWELIRLLVTTLFAMDKMGISNIDALNHFLILGEDYAPTIVIKKKPYLKSQIVQIKNKLKKIPKDFPKVTYLPYNWEEIKEFRENILLKNIKSSQMSLIEYIEKDPYDISPVWDDSPFFYKVKRGIPTNYLTLFSGIFFTSMVFVLLFLFNLKKARKQRKNEANLYYALSVFIIIGIGFMIFEISLFQQFVLYLGSPTLSLTILLGSLLSGMGIGSYFSEKIYRTQLIKKLQIVSISIVILGSLFLIFGPVILENLLTDSLTLNAILSFILLMPFGLLLGIPFPTALKFLRTNNLERYIAWMYGINGLMSVLGSISSIIISMLSGYTSSFIAGLILYFLLFIFSYVYSEKKIS